MYRRSDKPPRYHRSSLYNFKIVERPKFICAGHYLIVSAKMGVLQNYQIETLRLYLTKILRPFNIELFVRCLCVLPFTKKAKQARMGKGKGKIQHYFCRVDKNTVLFEIRIPKIQPRGTPRLTYEFIAMLLRRIRYRFSFTLFLSTPTSTDDLRPNVSFCNR